MLTVKLKKMKYGNSNNNYELNIISNNSNKYL